MDRLSIRTTENSVKGLLNLIGKIDKPKSKIMVEIGAYLGDSTTIFAEYFNQVFTIDPWSDDYEDLYLYPWKKSMGEIEDLFNENIKPYPNIYKYKMTSGRGTVLFEKESLDFVYIDGLHSYEGVKKDIELWLPKIKKGGWIGGHDYTAKFQGTIKAVKEKFENVDFIFEDTSWIVKIGE